jgi:hypothetical protein
MCQPPEGFANMTWYEDKSTAADPDNPAADEQLTAAEWNEHVTDGHFPADELNFGVDGGDPVLTDPQDADTVILRYDRTAGAWVLEGTNLDANGNDLVGVGTAEVDDLDIGDSDFVTQGDFIGLVTKQSYQRKFSTTSTSYVRDRDFFEWSVQWDTSVNPDVQGGVRYSFIGLAGSGETIDVRLHNTTDAETIVEITDAGFETDFVEYAPTTTSTIVFIDYEIRTSPGDAESTLRSPEATIGVQL